MPTLPDLLERYLNNGTPTSAHRTVTALDGLYAPLYTDTSWAVNPGNKRYARIWCDLIARGCTALTDEPILTIRTFLRSGAYVSHATANTSQTRPRLKDAPTIKCQKTVNNGSAYTDYSAEVVDNNVGTYANLNALDTVANGDWVVIGGPTPFIGAAIDMTASVNANASVMSVSYWNGAWTSVSNLTDGTVSSGKTLAVDGQISWDMPSDWVASTINSITAYWVRVSVSAVLSATVQIAEIDLLQPIKACLDIEARGYDVLALLISQDASVTGTMAYSGTLRVSWW